MPIHDDPASEPYAELGSVMKPPCKLGIEGGRHVLETRRGKAAAERKPQVAHRLAPPVFTSPVVTPSKARKDSRKNTGHTRNITR